MLAKDIKTKPIKLEPVGHPNKSEAAYDAGYKDGKAGNAYQTTSIPCPCTSCQADYHIGFENGQLALASQDD